MTREEFLKDSPLREGDTLSECRCGSIECSGWRIITKEMREYAESDYAPAFLRAAHDAGKAMGERIMRRQLDALYEITKEPEIMIEGYQPRAAAPIGKPPRGGSAVQSATLKPYDFSDAPFPIRFDIGDTVRFVHDGKELEGVVTGTAPAGDVLLITADDTEIRQPKTACVLVRKALSHAENYEQRTCKVGHIALVHKYRRPGYCPECSKQAHEELMNGLRKSLSTPSRIHSLPSGIDVQPAPVATQAKYFHLVESDGQKVMLGFQTYEELMHSLDPEKYACQIDVIQKHCTNCGANLREQRPYRAESYIDAPTIREASE